MGVFCWFLFAMEIRMQGKYVTQQCSSHIGISGLRFGWRKWHNYTETFLAHREAFSCKSGYTCFGFASTFFNATWQRRQRTVEDGSGWVGYVAIKMVRLLGSVWAVVVVVFLHALGFACRGLDFLYVCRRLVILYNKAMRPIFLVAVLQVIGSFAPLSAFPVEYVGKISACIQVCMSLGRNLAVDIQQSWLVLCMAYSRP